MFNVFIKEINSTLSIKFSYLTVNKIKLNLKCMFIEKNIHLNHSLNILKDYFHIKLFMCHNYKKINRGYVSAYSQRITDVLH